MKRILLKIYKRIVLAWQKRKDRKFDEAEERISRELGLEDEYDFADWWK